MQIALFGATGGTGRQVLEQALASGHTVTALVRDPAKIEARSGLTVVCGDVLDQEATSRCVQGADAVICILGSGVGAEPVEARGTQRIIEAMKSKGVRRLIEVELLEHQHAGHDRKSREMIPQVIFATIQSPNGHNPLSGFQFQHFVKLAKSHSCLGRLAQACGFLV